MWTKASELAKFTLNRSGVAHQVDAEHILQLANSIGKNEYRGVSFRDGLLVIAAIDADPVTLHAESLKIKNTLNKMLKSKLINSVRVISN